MRRGIDYGLGTTNVDKETGIRYGVISSHEVCQAWSDSSEADYGEPHCPKCGDEASEPTDDEQDDFLVLSHACGDYACKACGVLFDGEDAFGDEPNAWTLDDGEYKAVQGGDDSDIFILKSPYYTRAAFCSPSTPGACYLTTPCDDGEKAYCFGHDWFDDQKAPYPVYRVDTGELVPA